MRKILFIIMAACSLMMEAVELNTSNRDTNYVKAIIDRSQKVVDKLDMTDGEKAQQVRNIIANRYFALNDIYAQRDTTVNRAKASLTGGNKKMAVEAAENQKDAQLYKTHFAFVTDLSVYLNELQMEAVKDAMTFGVVKVTYDAQCDMIPTLKDDEKVQILAWLKEAREYAIDAESAKKKHECFGKYKGRINNYLSKRGYDLNKEREEWYKRVKARGGKL
jgi:hypothetical protein